MIDELAVEEDRIILKKFIDTKCVFRCDPSKQYVPNFPVGYIPGSIPNSKAKWQVYMRNLTQNSEMMFRASRVICHQMVLNNDFGKFQMAGLETASIPMISALQQNMRRFLGVEINSFIVRKERKGYGVFNYVDGIPNILPVCVVDDIINSGSSFHRTLDAALWEFDLDPHVHSYSILSLRPERKKIVSNGTVVHMNSIFTKDDINTEFSMEKYWEPFDCDKSFNKRPDYR